MGYSSANFTNSQFRLEASTSAELGFSSLINRAISVENLVKMMITIGNFESACAVQINRKQDSGSDCYQPGKRTSLFGSTEPRKRRV